MGGVIVDVHPERAIENFKSAGVNDADKFIGPSHHTGIFTDLESGKISAGEFCRLLSKHAGREILREDIVKAWKSIISLPPDYKLDFIRSLRHKHKVLLLTNNNPFLIEWVCTPGFTKPGESFADYFDEMYVSYQMKCTKPDIQIFIRMIQEAGINPSESLYIDDSELNIKAAEETGMHVYLAKNGEDWRNAVSSLIDALSSTSHSPS